MKSVPEKNPNIFLKFFKKILGSCAGLLVIIVFYPENRKNSFPVWCYADVRRFA